MKKKIFVFISILAFLIGFFIAKANAETPKLKFNEDTCSILVTARGEPQLQNYFVCITDEQYVGIYHIDDEDDVCCDARIGTLLANEWMNISEYVNCSIAVPNNEITWGTLKGCYR